MPRRTAAVALAAVLAGATGCAPTTGSGSSTKLPGAQGEVARVVADLQQAGERKDAERICTQILSRALVQRLSQAGTSCGQEIKKAIQDADDFTLSVQRVTVSGDRATATVRRGANGPTRTLRFVREAGRWKVTDLGAS